MITSITIITYILYELLRYGSGSQQQNSECRSVLRCIAALLPLSSDRGIIYVQIPHRHSANNSLTQSSNSKASVGSRRTARLSSRPQISKRLEFSENYINNDVSRYNSQSPNSVTDSDYYETWDSDVSLDDADDLTTVIVIPTTTTNTYKTTNISHDKMNILANNENDSNYNGDDEGSLTESATERRIADLQEELERLKSQIASIILANERQVTIPLPPPDIPDNYNNKCYIALSTNAIPDTNTTTVSRKLTQNNAPYNTRPDMLHVLGGMTSLRLKRVEKSPGGTPVRLLHSACTVNNPNDIIARALKAKFAKALPTHYEGEADSSIADFEDTL